MDDDYILTHGGDEHDIEEIARQNGADLTKEAFLKYQCFCKEVCHNREELYGHLTEHHQDMQEYEIDQFLDNIDDEET